MKNFELYKRGGIILSLACSSHLVLAENLSRDSNAVELETVTVVGQRKHPDSYTVKSANSATGLTLAPKDTPQSMSVITRKQLDDLGASTLEEALKYTTGLNIYKQSFQTRYQSRGFDIAQISEDGVNSTVCTMCGNNPHDQKQLTDTALYDRIEVVRGATGLKKAKSEPGGTINAIRKRPTTQRLAEMEVSADRFGTLRSTADVSGTLNKEDSVRGRLVTVLERNNSFRDHVDGGKAIIYGVVDKNFGDNDKITLGGSYHHETDTPPLFGLPGYTKDANGTFYPINLPRSAYLGADWNRSKYKKLNAFTELEHHFNEKWKATALIDYKQNHSDTEYGYVPQRNDINAATGLLTEGYTGKSDRYNHQWSFQIDLEGKFNGIGREHDLYAGYGYTREKFDNLWRGTPLKNGIYPAFSWTGHEIDKPDWDKTAFKEIRNTTKDTHTLSLATRLNATDNLHILLGTSYSRWRQSQYLSWMTKPYTHYQKGRWIPYLGITYDLNKNNSLYVSYSSIFNYSGDYYDINNKLMKPVMGNNYEAGWKSSWYNNRLNTTLALFQTEKHNQPVDTWLGIDPATKKVRPWVRGDQAVYTPVRMESRGVDAEISGNITDDWQIFAGYTFNKRRYTATAAEKTAERNGRGVDFSQHTPKHIFRLNTVYRLPNAANKWSVNAGVRVQSKSSPITVNNAKEYLGGYAIWDAGMQYEPSKNFKLSLKVNNLTDKRYYESYAHRATYQGHFYGEPRNVMFGMKWKM